RYNLYLNYARLKQAIPKIIMKEQYYPIVIPTLCRSVHLKRRITSLSQCTYAEQTGLVIGLDYPLNESQRQGYNEILEYLPEIMGFYKVTIFKRE
ncbi:MAG: hypothetical protein LUE99_14860, partial [Bacteroides sp.]|nr:hypothetical protein [Bacteroides sp.]